MPNSSSQQQPSPANIKALLAHIKAQLEQSPFQQAEGNSGTAESSTAIVEQPKSHPTTTTNLLVMWLLQLELLQRGVIVHSTSSNDPNDNVKMSTVLDQVQSEAGKPLWNINTPPHSNLLAGANVLQARVVEQLVSSQPQHQHHTDTTLASRCQSVFNRCRDVHDTRFQVILQSMLMLQSDDPSSSSRLTALLNIAEGCYYRAASLVDHPPMWKGAYDVLVSVQQQQDASSKLTTTPTSSSAIPWEGAFALENLLRIATSKNNRKRQMELSLQLIELYVTVGEHHASASLSQPNNVTTNTTTSAGTSSNKMRTNDNLNVDVMALHAYVASYRSLEPPTIQSCLEKSTTHLTVLRDYLDSAGDSPTTEMGVTNVQWHMWQLRHALLQHHHSMQQVAQDQYRTAQHRVTEASSSTNVSYAAIVQQTKRKYWQQLSKDETEPLVTQVQQLLQVLLRASSSVDHDNPSISRPYWQAAHTLIVQFLVLWHVEQVRANALQLRRSPATTTTKAKSKATPAETLSDVKQGWTIAGDILTAFLTLWHESHVPFLRSIDDQDGDDDGCRDDVLQHMLIVLPCLEWMHSSLVNEPETTSQQRLCSKSQLQIMLHWQQQMISATSSTATRTVLSTSPSSNRSESTRKKLEWAHRSTRAWLYLTDNDPSDQDRTVLNDILASLRLSRGKDFTSHDNSLEGELGTSYLEFVVAWNGLHQLPWSQCVTAEARTLLAQARSCLQLSESEWGRPTPEVEHWYLDMGQADAEATSATMMGGLPSQAQKLYLKVLKETTHQDNVSNDVLRRILQSKCCSGLVGLSLRSISGDNVLTDSMSDMNVNTPEDLARRNLELLDSIDGNDVSHALHLWTSEHSLRSSVQYQLAVARQQVADCLIRMGRTVEAEAFLEEAVCQSPEDPGAALSLGSFRLYLVFFGEKGSSADGIKAAQIQLLKAAKLDAIKASPFALLGYWYEFTKDDKRALGCYSRALLLDPSHPVAGRGLLRLKSANDLLPLLEKAADTGSPMNGWAWRALGLHKAIMDGNDDLAVVSFLQALRSHDMQNPGSVPLSAFFSSPFFAQRVNKAEYIETSAALAASYRRLGRFTASLRSYYASLEAAGAENACGAILNSCARVEMELGLYDEASNKLARAMESTDAQIHSVAAYNLSVCLLSMAKRDAQDGKAGAAFGFLLRALECCRQLDAQSGCVQKLMGDIHSVGAFLPPDVFLGSMDPDENLAPEESIVRHQLSFVAAGREAYDAAEKAIHGANYEETQVLRAGAVTDTGSNLLLQAQLLCSWQAKGLDLKSTESDVLYKQAEAEFRRALALSPIYPPAWCGLGCAVHRSDPLLAQHAFCRSLELDHLYPDPYANLSFLYTRHGALESSSKTSDALTQVADTPMMWINRALIWERRRDAHPASLQQAADAYRAALQVAPIPTAKYGLALSCRLVSLAATGKGRGRMDDSLLEANCLLSEYLQATGSSDIPARLFRGVSSLEWGASQSWSHSRSIVSLGQQQIADGLETLRAVNYSNGALDVESLNRATEPLDDRVEQVEQSHKDAETLKRMLLLEPHRGDLWLSLAKTLVRVGGSNQLSVKTASMAIEKATRILWHNATDPTVRPDKTLRPVPAKDVSDSLSLRYWLDQLQQQTNLPPKDVSSDIASLSHKSTLDLQESLILCPDNALARQALRSTQL